MSEIVNIICMKWGKKYDASYVNKLHSMVNRHLTLPFRFICLTDSNEGINEGIEIFPLPEFNRQNDTQEPKIKRRIDKLSTFISPLFKKKNTPLFDDPKIERAWYKLLTFSAPLYDLKGTALFLDLDIVIVDNIDEFFFPKADFIMIKDWTNPELTGNSSVYRFEIGKHPNVLANFINQEEKIRTTFCNEQEYLTSFMKKEGKINYWNSEIVKSFKRHCLHSGIKSWFQQPILPKKAKIVVFHGIPNPDGAIMGKSGKWLRKILPTKWVAEHWQ